MKPCDSASSVVSVDVNKRVLEAAATVLQELLPKWSLEDFVEVAIQNQLEIVKLCGGGHGLEGQHLRPIAPLTLPSGHVWPATGSRHTAKILQLVPPSSQEA